MAYLTPVVGGPAPSAAFVLGCIKQLADRGFDRVVTSALAPAEQSGFLAVGFAVEQDLQVLCHQLQELPRRSARRRPVLGKSLPNEAALAGSLAVGAWGLRRARADDRPAVLTIDHRAFSPFWHLDPTALREVLEATPRSRFCVVAKEAGDGVLGYAITGRTRRRGFLQRLAVDPSCFRHGIGRALVVDALRWLRRWHVERAMVNTQLGNEVALALYESLGFRRQPLRLAVLSRSINQ